MLEVRRGLHLAEESPCPYAQVPIEQGEHDSFEFRALLAVPLDPILVLDRKP